MYSTEPHPSSRRNLSIWIGCVTALVVAMVVIGGITRLTGSGLSIVEWRPVTGILPPLSDADWGDAFAAYQRTPQYRLLNGGMQLAQFQRIFFFLGSTCIALSGGCLALFFSFRLLASS